MTQLGKFFEKQFKNKEVELYVGVEREWITYSDSSAINSNLLCVIFLEYDENGKVVKKKK